MEIRQFLTPYMRSYSYIIIEGKCAIIIDPCELEEIKKLISESIQTISFCILTHEHFDHISGLDWIHAHNIPVIASEKCNKNLANTKLNQSRYYDVFCMLQKHLEGDKIPEVKEYKGYANKIFQNKMTLEWNHHHILLKETPGHSQGSICILIDNKYLFSGDTLFFEKDTNCNILGGDMKQLKQFSIPWLLSLDKTITVYPGHYKIFQLGDRMKGETK